jgi:hypothetical protein
MEAEETTVVGLILAPFKVHKDHKATLAVWVTQAVRDLLVAKVTQEVLVIQDLQALSQDILAALDLLVA